MTSPLTSLVKRYPRYWREIRTLEESSADFKSICCDYESAREALRQAQASPAESAARLRDEYQQIVVALEAELLELLATAEDAAESRIERTDDTNL